MKEMNFLYMVFFIFFWMLIFIMMLPSNLYKFHPLVLSILLIIYTMLLSFLLNFWSSGYWYSYILYLIMVGGVMILFMYFTSLNNNQLVSFYFKYYMYLYMKFFIGMMMLSVYMYKFDLLNFFLYFNYWEMFNYMNIFINLNNVVNKDLMMDYIMDINLYNIIYLFFTMICSVLICSKYMLPMRQLTKM